MHRSIVEFANYRYLKIGLALVAAAIAAYLIDRPFPEPNGGTWLGYGLGAVSALLIVWLAWFGVRKRRHPPGSELLEGWLSAHVYLGLSLIVVATLHTGFQFGLNVHTLAYALMMLVIASGVFGIWVYLALPARLADNRAGATLDQMMQEIADSGRECQEAAYELGGEFERLTTSAVEGAGVGGSLRRQLAGRDPACPNAAALAVLPGLARELDGERAALGRRLVSALVRRGQLLTRARRDVRYRALLRVWLVLHVPLTAALLAAVAAHIVSVFFYW